MGKTEIIVLIKRKLRKLSVGHLSVHKGGGIESWIEIHRKDHKMFNEKERSALKMVFGESAGKSNFFCIRKTVAEMVLGLKEKKPICPICGAIYESEKSAEDCWYSH